MRGREGDAIAIPVCARLDREDGMLEGFGDRPGLQVDRRAQQPDIAITFILGALWSSVRRRREMHRIEADWAAIDDRTHQDIGVSPYGLARVRDPRHWR